MVDLGTIRLQGKAAYTALLSGGTSGFNAVLGGNRSIDGQYDRLEAHGFYWTGPKTIRSPHCSITSAKAVKRSIVSPREEADGNFRAVCQGVTTQNSSSERHKQVNQQFRKYHIAN